jgi:hypothetical protein
VAFVRDLGMGERRWWRADGSGDVRTSEQGGDASGWWRPWLGIECGVRWSSMWGSKGGGDGVDQGRAGFSQSEVQL